MRPNNNLYKLIADLKTAPSTELDAKVNQAIDNALAERKRIESAYEPSIGRIIMRSPITKLAAAAVIVIAILTAAYFFTGRTPTITCCAWGDIIRPIMDANTAEFDIIVGDINSSPVIHDMIYGTKIRRTMENMEGVMIIDLANKRILNLDPEKKKAIYTDLKNSPLMPNQLDLIKNVIKTLENAPGFVVEQLGKQEIDGQLLYGFRAKHPKMNVVIYVDPQTALPVYMEWEGGQMKTICRNIRFNVPMDESLFSMEAPIGYKIERQQFDPFGSTEDDFIEDLRIEAEVLGDGVFPDDVSVEHFIKMTPVVKEKFDKLQKPEDEKTALVLKLHKGLMFIRYFKGEGKWYYAGKDVKIGDANTAIFWYRPAGSSTYHVIYGDLSVEDVNGKDLPQPVENQ